jgi:hypothetical protein
MNRIIYGDNQFFGVNHVSDEKARTQSIKFREDDSIVKTIKVAMGEGIDTFMCTTHERMFNISKLISNDPYMRDGLTIYPCLPYAHKYANAVTELGIMGTLKQYMPLNIGEAFIKGGTAFFRKDYMKMMELLIDAELKMFKNVHTPIIFLQNVITDLLLGLGMNQVLLSFKNYIETKYHAEAGFITMNMPLLMDALESVGVDDPIICSSINVDSFRMSGGKEAYENAMKNHDARIIAMQVFSGGSTSPDKALEYVCGLPAVESILFGASSRDNIRDTVSRIRKFDTIVEPIQKSEIRIHENI